MTPDCKVLNRAFASFEKPNTIEKRQNLILSFQTAFSHQSLKKIIFQYLIINNLNDYTLQIYEYMEKY